ncbi:site-specific integrase [Flavobacterium laiguense]|uniref:Tyrosine type site-specific recombinase n=1 Tax=Flavobacterium laiguense TaxID=2169409 RepID=A0A2U1JZ14_9FLAO|nr:site-specific integrase [Flavobacterium laiguense]PWA10466.1 tyrosine type site-specific recombinase [Flavobacterium laiguense]
MLKVIFYIKADKAKPNGEIPIYAKISFQGKETTMSTGKSIAEERWSSTNKLRNFLKLEKEKIIKQALDQFQLKVEKKFNELEKANSEVSLATLKEEINGKRSANNKGVTILSVMEKHNKFFKKKVDGGERSSASLQKYERAKELLYNFLKKHYALEDILTTEIDSRFVYKLEDFLKYESNFKGKIGIKNNSIVKYMKMYKTANNYAIRIGLIEKCPFKVYDGKIKITEGVFLSQHELNTIEEKHFSTIRLEKVKDLFLFSCYTGYAPIDASNLTANNLITDSAGNLWLKTNRTKTAIRANVPVLPAVLKIINKYKNQQIGLIPKMSNQKMNAYLKEIADLCEIEKHLTWYVARHTFATTVTLGNGVRLENVSAMMGHTNIKQTQHYAKVLDINIMEDMAKLKSKYS